MTNAVNLSALGSNGGITSPTWTTATRPSSPYTGQMGYNTTTAQIEVYGAVGWVNAGTAGNSYTISYLVLAGGGSGGSNIDGGGGGAGGYLSGTTSLTKSSVYTATTFTVCSPGGMPRTVTPVLGPLRPVEPST